MKILFNKKFLEHNVGSDFEGHYRIKDFADKYKDTEIDFDPVEHILQVHTKNYLERFQQACLNHGYAAEVNLSPSSYDAALLATGLTILAAKNDDFAVVRPPGHHTRKEYPSGFCFLNNIAIATQELINQGKKVAILDIDGHRGDGTQEIFENEPHVFICSIHQKYAFAGDGTDTENMRNYALVPPVAERTYISVFHEAIQQIKNFKPYVVGVSAGFDTHKDDKLLDFRLTTESYHNIGKTLGENFRHVFAVLEGGYHNHILDSVESFVEGVNISHNP